MAPSRAGWRIGWITGHDVYLEPSVSYAVAEELAGNSRIPVSGQTLHLHERGLLARVDQTKGTLKLRRTLEGGSREALHFRASDFVSAGAALKLRSGR